MTTAQAQYAPSITLAQQALDTYDRKGEFAMLPFIMNNVRSSEDSHHNWLQDGFCLLDDASDIIHSHGKYTFGWHSQETDQETHAQRFFRHAGERPA